jgi:hypothetical protein
MMKEKKVFDEDSLETLRQVLKEQIEKPVLTLVNSEHSFVAQKLYEKKKFDISLGYWHWITMNRHKTDYFPADIMDLIAKLDEVDKKNTISSWGTYGT